MFIIHIITIILLFYSLISLRLRMYKVLANGEQVPVGAIVLTVDQIKQLGLKICICMNSDIPASVSNETTTENKVNTNKKKKEVANVKSNNSNTVVESENSDAKAPVKKEKKQKKKDSRWCSNGWTCNKKDSGCKFKHSEGRLATCRVKNCSGDCGNYHKKPKTKKTNSNTNNDEESSDSDSEDDDESSVAESLTNSTNNS